MDLAFFLFVAAMEYLMQFYCTVNKTEKGFQAFTGLRGREISFIGIVVKSLFVAEITGKRFSCLYIQIIW